MKPDHVWSAISTELEKRGYHYENSGVLWWVEGWLRKAGGHSGIMISINARKGRKAIGYITEYAKDEYDIINEFISSLDTIYDKVKEG